MTLRRKGALMSESVRLINFEHFRGLPGNEFNLNGKNLVLLGANGKGKSALVDGIEFLLSGQVMRFTGTGTGGISHNNVVKNVKTGGDPKVVLTLSPSNGKISRNLSSGTIKVADTQPAKDFFDQHSRISGFILRRSNILDFVCDQDADRYKKFVRLLGITKVDLLQRRFEEAYQQAKLMVVRTTNDHQTKLIIFNDTVSGFVPINLGQVFAHISNTVESFGLEKLEKWEDAEARLPLLKDMRPQVNNKKIDALTRALMSVEYPLAISSEDDIRAVNELPAKIAELAESSVDASRSRIIDEGRKYLVNHVNDTYCPLCETQFEQPLEVLLARLKERSDALQELRDSESKRKTALARIKQHADKIGTQIKNDLKHSELFDADSTLTLRHARAAALRFSRRVIRVIKRNSTEDISIPSILSTVPTTRSALATALNKKKKALMPPDSKKLEASISLIERGIVYWKDIKTTEQEIVVRKTTLQRTTIAKDLFTSAREKAIQQVFTQISETVLSYYKCLHDFGEGDETSECTAIELKPTSRAAAGGLQLVTQFLGLVNSKDPRAFLSDGHLDSLGLCLFLAIVRIFNPPGSLLVLDDVLTSIDKEHRRRVGDLLYSEFQDFQIVLTTHDEHWHDLLASTAQARGVQSDWRYIKLQDWTLETGPILSVVETTWDFINSHLTEADYRNLGSPFRFVIEGFLKRTAAKLELKVKFKSNGNYTSGDFVFAGIQNKVRDELVKLDKTNKADILNDISKVFGQANFINDLSHDNRGNLDITFDQAKDFAEGLKSLIKRCEDHNLIKGH